MNKQWLYTMISRAKKTLHIIGALETIPRIIEKNNDPRITILSVLLPKPKSISDKQPKTGGIFDRMEAFKMPDIRIKPEDNNPETGIDIG
jgi:hypothetical protein